MKFEKSYIVGTKKRQVGYRLDSVTADNIDLISKFYNCSPPELIDQLIESNLKGENFFLMNGDLDKVLEILNKVGKNERVIDTVIAPSKYNTFVNMFLGNGIWSCIGLSPRMATTEKLKYFACYESAPISAVRFYAEIDKIEQNSIEKCKYDIYMKGDIKRLNQPVIISDKGAGLRHFMYTNLNDLLNVQV